MLSKREIKKSSLNKSIAIALLIFISFISFRLIMMAINTVVNKSTKIQDTTTLSNYFLGMNEPVRILMLFENNAETRFGGGFVGTVGHATIEKGVVKPGSVRSVYYYDYRANDPEYYTEDVKNSAGQIEKKSFSLRNVVDETNWEQSARRASKIFEQESGIETDVVVGITPEMLKSLLKKTGPITLSDYNLVINDENLLSTIQLEVESGQDKAERKDPKSVLTSLANALIQKISQQNIETISKYYPDFYQLLVSRQIAVFSKDYDVQSILKKQGFTGEHVEYDGDYLYVSESNRNASKTGAFIKRSLDKQIKVSGDGKTEISTKLTRNHTAPEYLHYYFDPEFNGYKYLVASDNVEVRIAVPKGAIITGSSMPITKLNSENRYDVYSFSSDLEPASTASYTLNYELPFKIAFDNELNYNSYIQLPVGTHPFNIHECVQVPSGYSMVASNKSKVNISENNVCYDVITSQDNFLSLFYAKN